MFVFILFNFKLMKNCIEKARLSLLLVSFGMVFEFTATKLQPIADWNDISNHFLLCELIKKINQCNDVSLFCELLAFSLFVFYT